MIHDRDFAAIVAFINQILLSACEVSQHIALNRLLQLRLGRQDLIQKVSPVRLLQHGQGLGSQ